MHDPRQQELQIFVVGTRQHVGDLRLIEAKGIGEPDSTMILTSNEHCVGRDRRNCCWLYVVTNCDTGPKLMAMTGPAPQAWEPARRVPHYALVIAALHRRGAA